MLYYGWRLKEFAGISIGSAFLSAIFYGIGAFDLPRFALIRQSFFFRRDKISKALPGILASLQF
jgi:hypothetical protein